MDPEMTESMTRSRSPGQMDIPRGTSLSTNPLDEELMSREETRACGTSAVSKDTIRACGAVTVSEDTRDRCQRR